MSSIEVDGLKSVHYRAIAKACVYCHKRPKVLRATIMQSGEVLVAALCKHHAKGEIDSETGGMRNPEGTSDFYVEAK